MLRWTPLHHILTGGRAIGLQGTPWYDPPPDLGGAHFGKIRVNRPMLTDAEPAVLSDILFDLHRRNPTLKAAIILLHATDSDILEKTLSSKLPRQSGPRTSYWVTGAPSAGVNIFSVQSTTVPV